MNIPYIDTIFLGIVRLLLWVFFLYLLKRLFIKDKPSQNQVKTMGNYWAVFGSVVLVLIYVLVQVNSYDLLTIIAFMIFFFGFRLIGVKQLKLKNNLWLRRRKAILINVIENIEDKEPIIDVRKAKANKRFSVKAGFYFATLACFTAMMVRFYLMQFDNYQLSAAWFQELKILDGLSDQRWFNNEMVMTGQYALMSFYGLITGISAEMALESFGLFQIFILCFVIFWFIDAMTNSLVTIPLLGTLAFALFFNLVPINLTQITHSKSTFMAMTFFLPALIFIRKPWVLYKNKRSNYFWQMLVIFCAIALIDLFTLLILLPPYFMVVIPFIRRGYWKFFMQSFWAYLGAYVFILGSFALSAYNNDTDFFLFLRSNLLSVSSTTTTGNMILSYDTLIWIFQGISLVGGVVMFFLYRDHERKWASPLAFIIYVNVMILYSTMGFEYFDRDLFNEILPVLVACALSLVFYIIYYYFNTRLTRVEIPDKVSVPLIFALFLVTAYYSQPELVNRTSKTNSLSKTILEAYQNIKASFIPYGYAVVNASNMLPMSRDSHIFIGYDDFLNAYPERDSVYFEYKDDKEFLRLNTEYILPNSVLVFIYHNVSDEFRRKVRIEEEVQDDVVRLVNDLRLRGRPIRLFYEKDNLRVYEIVNKPKEARIKELL